MFLKNSSDFPPETRNKTLHPPLLRRFSCALRMLNSFFIFQTVKNQVTRTKVLREREREGGGSLKKRIVYYGE